MMKINCRSLALVVLLTVVVFMAGCETLKGAAQGFKQDVDNLTKLNERLAW